MDEPRESMAEERMNRVKVARIMDDIKANNANMLKCIEMLTKCRHALPAVNKLLTSLHLTKDVRRLIYKDPETAEHILLVSLQLIELARQNAILTEELEMRLEEN